MAGAVIALVGLLGCRPTPAVPTPSPTSRADIDAELRADEAAVRHASDGGGTITLLEAPEAPPIVGTTARYVMVYEVGPLGVAPGGAIVFQSPPFWGWSPAQVGSPQAPGYTTVTTSDGTLTVSEGGQGMVIARVEGAPLVAGSRVEIVYGAGVAGVTVDRHPEVGERLGVAVDGDGDGVRAWVAGSPRVPVVAGPPVGLWVTTPTTATPGEPVRVTVAALDAYANRSPAGAGRVVALDGGAGWSLPERVVLDAYGTAAFRVAAPAQGWVVVSARAEDLNGRSEGMLVHPDAPPIRWVDLHVHTGLSDGSGTPEDAWRYARDVAGLDGAAVTDHDHWGIGFVDRTPNVESELRGAAATWDDASFAAYFGWEWTSWTWGHRHVIEVQPGAPLIGGLDVATPEALFERLASFDVLVVPHHTAGGPVPLDPRWMGPSAMEPAIEVVSVHGSSESDDAWGRIYGWTEGATARALLARHGPRGFLGAGDSHDGHPGLAHLAGGSGGLTAVWTTARDRVGIAAAIRARRTVATNGARFLLRVRAGEAEAGGTVPHGSTRVEARVVAGRRVERVELVRVSAAVDRTGVIEQRFPVSGVVREVFEDVTLEVGEMLYVRARLEDGAFAIASPFVAAP